MRKFWIGTIGALVLVACSTPPQVYVQCQAGIGAVQCSLQHQAGDKPAKVCWDVRFSCVNGKQLKARECQDVGMGATVGHAIPDGKFAGLDQCDSIISTAVENLVVTPL